MPAPDNLAVQTPGVPITQATTEQTSNTSTEAKEPEFSAKHNGGGRQRIWSNTLNDWFSDFVATGEGAKQVAQAEADRLNAGGAAYVKPEEQATTATAQATTEQPTQQQPTQQQAARTQAVLTDEGWLVPDLPVAYRKE